LIFVYLPVHKIAHLVKVQVMRNTERIVYEIRASRLVEEKQGTSKHLLSIEKHQ